MDIQILKFTKEDQNLYETSLHIRKEVFVNEQKVPANEELEYEDESVFYLLLFEGKPACTARYRMVGDKIKLERFATLKEFRHKGLASELLKYILKDIEKTGKQVYLHAQAYITSLYEKEGFVKVGDIFYEANIPHYKMILKQK